MSIGASPPQPGSAAPIPTAARSHRPCLGIEERTRRNARRGFAPGNQTAAGAAFDESQHCASISVAIASEQVRCHADPLSREDAALRALLHARSGFCALKAQHRLYFMPDPQGHGLVRGGVGAFAASIGAFSGVTAGGLLRLISLVFSGIGAVTRNTSGFVAGVTAGASAAALAALASRSCSWKRSPSSATSAQMWAKSREGCSR